MFQAKQSEDTIFYHLFPNVSDGSSSELASKRVEYLSYLSSWLLNHIWQNENFRLNISEGSMLVPDHLYGTACVADHVEDEWFIVFLLRSLTEMDRDLIVQVKDSDGEFLLIEAADYLPDWLEPETSENRIWLYRGELHIIPQPSPSGNNAAIFPDSTPCLEEAIRSIRCHGDKTVASPKIQNAIRQRLSEYPQCLTTMLHKSHVILPHRAACILRKDPQLISAAIQAFYYRDPIDLKACRSMQYFKPENLVKTQVTFSRCLFAQVSQQKFCPDSRSGWTPGNASDPNYKAYSIGMKLCHGLEIAASRVKSTTLTKGPKGDGIMMHSLNENSPAWLRFQERLINIGYFKGELPGSKLYTQLLDKAKIFYVDVIYTETEERADAGVRILQIIQEPTCVSLSVLEEEEKCLSPPDAEDWLDVNPAQLDEMLQRASGNRTGGPPPQQSNDDEIPDAVRRFASKVSSFEGAELPCGSPQGTRDDEEGGAQGIGSLIRSMNEALTVKDDFVDGSSSDGDELEDYASDEDDDDDEASGMCSPGSTQPARVAGLPNDDELARLTHEKRSRVIREQMRDMRRYMKDMDRELKDQPVMQGFKEGRQTKPVPTALSKPPKTKKAQARLAESEDLDSDDSDEDPTTSTGVPSQAKVDSNLRAGLSQSFAAQAGVTGPSGALLESIGVSMHQRTSTGKSGKR